MASIDYDAIIQVLLDESERQAVEDEPLEDDGAA